MKIPKVIDKILTITGYVLTIVPYIVMGAYAAASGDKIVADDNIGLELIAMGALLFLSFFFVYVHIMIHEGGHLLAGLWSGWKYLSFRVGQFVLVKQNGKLRWKKTTLMGTGGQCLMIPPKCEPEQCPFFLYFLGGGMANLLTSAVILIVGICAGGFVQIVCNLFAILGIGLGISNLFPAKMGGTMNDGYQMLFELPKNNLSKTYFYCLMTANGILTEAESTKAIPENTRKILMELDDVDFNNTFAVNLLLYKNLILQEEGRYEEARRIFQKIVDSPEALGIFKREAECELLYYEIMDECDEDKIEGFMDKTMKEYIKATALYPSRKRLMYAYYLIYKKDETAANEEYETLLKVAKTHPTKAEAVIEMKEAARIRAYHEGKRKFQG